MDLIDVVNLLIIFHVLSLLSFYKWKISIYYFLKLNLKKEIKRPKLLRVFSIKFV